MTGENEKTTHHVSILQVFDRKKYFRLSTSTLLFGYSIRWLLDLPEINTLLKGKHFWPHPLYWKGCESEVEIPFEKSLLEILRIPESMLGVVHPTKEFWRTLIEIWCKFISLYKMIHGIFYRTKSNLQDENIIAFYLYSNLKKGEPISAFVMTSRYSSVNILLVHYNIIPDN